MKRKVFLFNIVLTICCFSYSQKKDSIQQLSEIIVENKIPITKEIISKTEISKQNFGKDIPIILDNTQSVVTTSDAGTGIGYTGLRIRGSDASRINITINGIPVNDAESQATFWVNMPDLASNLASIQIQRGVGSSTNGAVSFGASINMEMQKPSDSLSGYFASSYGSFNSLKNSFQFNSGEIIKNLTTKTQISYIQSDGYIDRAFSKLYSFHFQANYQIKNSEISFLTFGGKEKTYQAWYGIDQETLRKDRKLNFAGAIYDSVGNIINYYNNQTDNYSQNNYQLQWKYRPNDNIILNTTIHYTKGKGYYEEYHQNQNLNDYYINNSVSISDLQRQLWLNNDFYGISSQLYYQKNNWNFIFGASANQYLGYHYGKVIGVNNISNFNEIEYYRNLGKKNEFSSFAKAIYTKKNWQFYGDLQYRFLDYSAEEKLKNVLEGDINFQKKYNFINPKAGITYNLNKGKVYFSYGLAQKEPTRTDIIETPTIQSETLHDFELGYHFKMNKLDFKVNIFKMLYNNQLILTGKLDNVGNPIRENSGESYRQGMEISLDYTMIKTLKFLGNITFSKNKNIDFNYNNTNIGNTSIAFSPEIISSFGFEYQPIKNLQFKFISKYISEQFLTNYEAKNSKLPSYFQSNIFVNYNTKVFKNNNLDLSFAAYNIFETDIISNGYYYNNAPFYYPQSGINFMIEFRFGF